MMNQILVLALGVGAAVLGTILGTLYVKRRKKNEKYDPIGKW